MNNQSPTNASEPAAQSGPNRTATPSDRAIAQAFREAKQQFGGRGRWQSNSEWIDWRASEIDAKQPPAGARDAALDQARELMDTIAMGIAGARARNTTDLCVGLIHAGNAVSELRGVVAALTGKAAPYKLTADDLEIV